MGVVRWFRVGFFPWTRGRMFRTGVPLDQEIDVTSRVATVANGITLLRLLGLPVFVYLAARHAWLIAFIVGGVLAALDPMDGYVARRFNQSTKLGSALDTLTDRLSLVTLSITLALVDVIRLWLVILIILRVALRLVMPAIFRGLGRSVPITGVAVTRLGKVATMTLLTSLPFLLLAQSDLPGRFAIHGTALSFVCVGIVLYYVRFGQYVKAGITR
jgi:cardiolipin synthase (CMP-forming)